MTRLRHRWSDPDRIASDLTIRTCQKCSLVWWSRHNWNKGRIGDHWSEYYTEANPDVRLTKMPECVAVEVGALP